MFAVADGTVGPHINRDIYCVVQFAMLISWIHPQLFELAVHVTNASISTHLDELWPRASLLDGCR